MISIYTNDLKNGPNSAAFCNPGSSKNIEDS
jgi:hypothetical protein